jgi:glutathione S-transferase
MTIQLYGHPFAAFVWKPLIAAYERNVPFEFRMVDPDHTDNSNRMAQRSATEDFDA